MTSVSYIIFEALRSTNRFSGQIKWNKYSHCKISVFHIAVFTIVCIFNVFFNRFLLIYCFYSDKADWSHINTLAKQHHFECFDIIALRSNTSLNSFKLDIFLESWQNFCLFFKSKCILHSSATAT